MTASGRDAWQNEPLGALGQLIRGRGGTKADERESGLPCIRYGELYTRHDFVVREFFSFISPSAAGSYTRLREGDVIFAASGETLDEIGKAAAYCDNSVAYAGSDTIIFRPGARVDGRFLGYVVNHEPANRYKSRMGQGSTVMHIGTAALARMPIDLPPLPEQQRIAEILDTLDEAIRKTEQVIAKLQQVKQGLLHDLLTRGIDEHGELRDPDRHPEQFKDSELGRVPRDWEVTTIGGVFSIQSGLSLGPHRRPTSRSVPYLRVGNVFRGRIDFSDVARFDATRSELAERRIEIGDLLVVEGHANVDEIGRVARADDRAQGMTFQNHLFRLRSLRAESRFSELFLNGQVVRSYWRRVCSTSSGLNTINQSLLRGVPFLLPPEREQVRIVAAEVAVSARIVGLTSELAKLHALKSALMHDLLTGRVRTSAL